MTSDLQYDLAERALVMEVAKRFSGTLQRVGPLDKRHDCAAGDQRHDLVPRLQLCGRGLCSQHKSEHAGTLPDQVGHVDLGLMARAVAERHKCAVERERTKRLSGEGTAKALDHGVGSLAVGDPS